MDEIVGLYTIILYTLLIVVVKKWQRLFLSLMLRITVVDSEASPIHIGKIRIKFAQLKKGYFE